MKKRIISLVLATCMVTSLIGCGSSSNSASEGANQSGTVAENGEYQLNEVKFVVNGTLTATQANGQAEFVEQWNKAVSEKLGHDIKLNVQQVDHSGYQDTIGRLFASGEYPDVMIMSMQQVNQYAPSGVLWDMADAYKNAEFQARMDLPEINENFMKNNGGHLYGFAYGYGNGCVTYIKQKWLDAVGLSVDDIKTYDDYYNMLLKFHNEDPDGNGINGDTYGVISQGYGYKNYLPEFWQDGNPDIHQDENGVWIDGFTTDASKAALARLRQGYLDGCIDPETLTASTKIAREKWFSNDQTGSSGVLTYWAGSWYQTLVDNLVKNEVDSNVVQLPPIKEVGAYINREAPCLVIIDDGDSDNSREQAVFDAFMETMLDGDTVQMLWTYGAEGVHWSTEAETFTTNAGTDKEKVYEYQDGEFHLKQSLLDPNTLWKKNVIDPALVIAHLTNGYEDSSELAKEGNSFFINHCVDAPASPSCDTLTNESGNIDDAKNVCITAVVVEGADIEESMAVYTQTVGSIVDQVLTELNAQSAE